jgi:hypothetical protein
LFLLLCGGMHFFMHRGHGGHGSHGARDRQDGGVDDERCRAGLWPLVPGRC